MPVIFLMFSLLAPHLMPQTGEDDPPWTRHRLIAHAMGGIDGMTNTNAYDAFIANYEKGFRVFEVDLQLTSDGELVARHDWRPYLYDKLGQPKPDLADDVPLTHAQFKSLTIGNGYRPLDFAGLAELMEKHPDVYIVTDTKSGDPSDVKKHFSIISRQAAGFGGDVLRRIVPQIYNQGMYETLEEVYPFSSYIYTLYQSKDSHGEVLEFITAHPKIKAVTMPEQRVSRAFTAALKEAGVVTYVHTVNEFSDFEKYRMAGIDGIYTDFLDKQAIENEIRMKRKAAAAGHAKAAAAPKSVS